LCETMAVMANRIAASIDRTKTAYRETSLWAKNKLLVSLMATVAVRASTQHLGRSHMTWAEIGLDLLIVIACYGAFLILNFVWNFIFAPARLKRELKRKAGQASLDEVLTSNANEATSALNKLIDADEEKDE